MNDSNTYNAMKLFTAAKRGQISARKRERERERQRERETERERAEI